MSTTEPNEPHPKHPWSWKKRLAIGLLPITCLLGILVLFGQINLRRSEHARLYAAPRKEWKEKAIAEINRLSNDSKWLESEIATLKKQSDQPAEEFGSWYSDHLILLKNGDWIVCSSSCSKTDNRIHDIFIGRASDGKWYYSTFHFCSGKIVLSMRVFDKNLGNFKTGYHLKEFDGRSDECLQKTWPPKR